jgi:hypothetical protein
MHGGMLSGVSRGKQRVPMAAGPFGGLAVQCRDVVHQPGLFTRDHFDESMP